MAGKIKISAAIFFAKKMANEAVRLRPYGLRRDKQGFASVRECLSGFICRKIAKKPQLPHKKQPTATLGKYPSGSPDFHDNLCYDIGNAVSNLSVILHPWR